MTIHCISRLRPYLIIVSGLFLSNPLMAYTTDLSTHIENNYFLTSIDESRSNSSTSNITRLIKSNYNPPSAHRGSVQRSIVTIRVNGSGDILQISASGADEKVNNAAKQAVLKTGNLPIDSSNPLYPTFSIIFNGTTD